MINMLIANKDIFKLKDLVNEVIANSKNIRIAKLTTDGEETLKALNNDDIDVALIEVDLPTMTGIEVLGKLTKEKKQKYRHSIIVVSEEFKAAQEIIENEMVYDYILKDTNHNEMLYKIDKMVKEKDVEENKKKIVQQLRYLGYKTKYVGTNYLIETILQIYINRELMLDNLKKDVYPIIAKKYGKSVHNIKCNINRATECMYYECDSARLRKYFGLYDDTKPTSKTVMFTVLNRIS